MIKTIDGVVKKRSQFVFELAVNEFNNYVPICSTVHKDLQNENNAYSTRELCQAECEKRNKRRSQLISSAVRETAKVSPDNCAGR